MHTLDNHLAQEQSTGSHHSATPKSVAITSLPSLLQAVVMKHLFDSKLAKEEVNLIASVALVGDQSYSAGLLTIPELAIVVLPRDLFDK